MELAKQNAENGIKNNEGGPFGAVITDKEGNIIANGNNKVFKNNDPTAHAEIVACLLYTSAKTLSMLIKFSKS